MGFAFRTTTLQEGNMNRNQPASRVARIRSLGCIALSGWFAACASTPAPVSNVSGDGKRVSLQLSRDGNSTLPRAQQKDYLDARKKLLGQKPTASAMLNSIAELSLLAGRSEEARTQARDVLKRDVKNVEALETLVKVALFTDRLEEAKLLAENALSVKPREPDLLCLRGLTSYMRGELVAAREDWKRALELAPGHVTAQMNLGALYYQNRNLAAAGASFEKVLALQPENLDAKIGKGLVLSAQGAADEAREQLRAVYKRQAENPLVLLNLATLERDRFENPKAALEYVEEYLALENKDRGQVERAIAERETLRKMVAAGQTKMTDAQVREMAGQTSQAQSSPASTAAGESARETDAVKTTAANAPAQTQNKAAEKAPAAKSSSPSLATDDPNALEDALK